jgi:hypothetical protein
MLFFSASVSPGPIIIGEYFPKLTIKIKYHKVKIGNQVLIKEFQVNFLKSFKQMVKKMSQNTSIIGLNHSRNKDIIKLKTQ